MSRHTRQQQELSSKWWGSEHMNNRRRVKGNGPCCWEMGGATNMRHRQLINNHRRFTDNMHMYPGQGLHWFGEGEGW